MMARDAKPVAKRGTKQPLRDETIRRRVLPIYNAIGYLTRRLDQRITQRFEVPAGGRSLTRAQFVMLAVISLVPDLEQAELASVIGYDPATTGVVVGRLENLGLVERRRSDRSRRGWQLRTSREGERIAVEQLSFLDTLQDQVLAPLEPAERIELLRLLSKLLGVSNGHYEPPKSDNDTTELGSKQD